MAHWKQQFFPLNISCRFHRLLLLLRLIAIRALHLAAELFAVKHITNLSSKSCHSSPYPRTVTQLGSNTTLVMLWSHD
ncbi:uncharacterized protein K441DRAFT_289640 [Cenococcum geophilum 1.58]|uniref:uncharacterized protein n=1 Tax=Cenococcum geophilum 1.58 TaxID=794803 RepID=UPI00358FC1A8|nr:hypothetical protein K441DRAFT_289640 [Cenococcum geophilum 1.58]